MGFASSLVLDTHATAELPRPTGEDPRAREHDNTYEVDTGCEHLAPREVGIEHREPGRQRDDDGVNVHRREPFLPAPERRPARQGVQ